MLSSHEWMYEEPCNVCDFGIRRVIESSGLDPAQGIPGFGQFDPMKQPEPGWVAAAMGALNAAKKWATGKGPRNVILSGPVGVGKTHLAKSAAFTSTYLGHQSRYIEGARFEESWLNFDVSRAKRMEVIRTLGRVPYLVFEDMGAGMTEDRRTGRLTPELQSRIEDVLNGRYERELRTLVTTNFTRAELEPWLGVRAFDRLMSHSLWLSMPGKSMR
jgi:DNA replication protein DnaC